MHALFEFKHKITNLGLNLTFESLLRNIKQNTRFGMPENFNLELDNTPFSVNSFLYCFGKKGKRYSVISSGFRGGGRTLPSGIRLSADPKGFPLFFFG